MPIIPIGFWSSNNVNLNSWDSFLITYPFSKCVFVWSDPIKVPNKVDDDEIQKLQEILENKINECIEIAKSEVQN